MEYLISILTLVTITAVFVSMLAGFVILIASLSPKMDARFGDKVSTICTTVISLLFFASMLISLSYFAKHL